MLLPGFAGGIEDRVGFPAGESFIPEMQRQAGHRCQLLCEGACFGRLGAQFSGKVERIAGDDARAIEFAAEARQRAQVG